MPKTRREFLRLSAAVGFLGATPHSARSVAHVMSMSASSSGASGTPGRASATPRPTLNPATLAKYVDPLPVPLIMQPQGERQVPLHLLETSAGGIGRPGFKRRSQGGSASHEAIRALYYRVEMREVDLQVHRDLPPTRQWAYGGSVPGPTFEVRSGQGILIDWVNQLPREHLLPIDHTLHGAAETQPAVRAIAHVHGAKVRPQSDGYPEHWYLPGEARLQHYPNRQDAATLWYHDHAMGITRLNVFAGLFGFFLVRDDVEDALNLPRGAREVPLVLYDRLFDHDGQLLYPVSKDPAAPWVAECYGNAPLCNGKLFPYLDVQPRRYRLRLLNAANTRFFHLTLSGGRRFEQVGSDQGLLPAPAVVNSLTLFPGERADVLVDFSALQGQTVQLCNETQELMQFRVAVPRGAQGVALSGDETSASDPLPAILRPVSRTPESESVRTRELTLAEHDDPNGNSMLMLLNGAHWDMPVTENPTLGSVEIWSLINLTGDTHPIHLHLVRFQVLDRRPLDLFAYNATRAVKYTGPATPPEPGEAGWKDTVRADPATVTRIIIRFEGFAGRYVWHCHLLEHEDNEMMRPYDVLPSNI